MRAGSIKKGLKQRLLLLKSGCNISILSNLGNIMKKFLIYSALVLGLNNLCIQAQAEVCQRQEENQGKSRFFAKTCAGIASYSFCKSVYRNKFVNKGNWDDVAFVHSFTGMIFSALANIEFLRADYEEYRELSDKYNNLKQKYEQDGNQAIEEKKPYRKILILPALCGALTGLALYHDAFNYVAIYSALATAGYLRASHKEYLELKSKYDSLKQKHKQAVLEQA